MNPSIPAAQDMTIAITVYSRRDYVFHAIQSALAQKTRGPSPRVIVVEDCGPDETLQAAVTAEFGGQINYHRNRQRRGLFDNWNACLDLCATEWLCILHDDDTLEPTFATSMIELAQAAPERALYYGACRVVDADGNVTIPRPVPKNFQWHALDLESWTRFDPVCFPGQLFNVACAKAVGGFRRHSKYCGDWEMWFKLAHQYGSAATNRVIANYREHHSVGRGTTNVDVAGTKYALVNVQRRRHIAALRPGKPGFVFDRAALFREAPIPTRYLFRHGAHFSERFLRYNAGLLLHSHPPHFAYWLLQAVVRMFTWRALHPLSWLYRLFHQ